MSEIELKPGTIEWVGDPTKMPASIVKAINVVQKTLDSVAKSQTNSHGGYKFASTDDIYAAITKKIGEVGLVITPLEDDIEIVTSTKDGKDSRWLKAVYSFMLSTETETWLHPRNRRTVMLPVSGPQSFAAAESFASKAFLRHLLMIPTGDLDLDALPENVEFGSVFSRAPVPPPPPPASDDLDKKLANAGPEEIVWDDDGEILK